jgi:HPr kinase/phosphorylase
MSTRGRGNDPLLPLAMASAEGPGVAVAEMLEDGASALQLELLAGQVGLDHRVHMARVQRPGLALTGYTDYIRYGRVQIVGSSEIGYLKKLSPRRRTTILSRLCRCRITCFVVTKALTPPKELVSASQAAGIPLLATPLESTTFIKFLSGFLEDRLATRLHLHGVLLDVFGVGVLILGDSGIGKSECALDLIDRGHRLVADDVVEIKKMGEVLVGASPDLTRYHMELRGLGVLNIRDLYGVSSISLSKRLGLVILLERWEEGQEYDRLGLRDELFLILGLEVPLLRMPVAPGRNIALLAEVAARNQLLREGGYDAARRFVERVDAMIASPAQGKRPVPERSAAREVTRETRGKVAGKKPRARAARRKTRGRPSPSKAAGATARSKEEGRTPGSRAARKQT